MFWNRKGIFLKKGGKILENWMVDNYFIIMEIVGVNFLENEYFCVIVGLKRFNYIYNLN